jgi:hypothetical protein
MAQGLTSPEVGEICTNLNSSGRLVTTPLPLGKKSNPTIFSKREDFPED